MFADDVAMATTVMAKRRRWPPASGTGLRISVWQAVVLSRLLVLAAGSAGALFTRPLPGWQLYDPFRLSKSLGPIGNVLAAAVVRWDSVGYVTLAEHGYQHAQSTVLFPLYPILIHCLTPLVGSPVIAGVLISLSAFGVGLVLVHRLAREQLGAGVADTTVLLLAFAPWSFVFSADYTTSLLLMCGAATFYLAQRDHFVLACVAAAAAAVTHVQGILLVAPLAVIYWKSRGRTFELRRLWSPSALALALPPLALAIFFLYMHARGWGWFAPITNQNAQNASRTFVGPLTTVFDSFKDAFIGVHESLGSGAPPTGGFGPGPQNMIYLVVLGIAILGLGNSWHRLPREYTLFALLAILVCTSSAVALEPLKGFDRYMLPIFPLWIGAAGWISERRVTAAVLAVSITLLIVETIQFTRWVSVF
jgi:hypothetical protein